MDVQWFGSTDVGMELRRVLGDIWSSHSPARRECAWMVLLELGRTSMTMVSSTMEILARWCAPHFHQTVLTMTMSFVGRIHCTGVLCLVACPSITKILITMSVQTSRRASVNR